MRAIWEREKIRALTLRAKIGWLGSFVRDDERGLAIAQARAILHEYRRAALDLELALRRIEKDDDNAGE